MSRGWVHGARRGRAVVLAAALVVSGGCAAHDEGPAVAPSSAASQQPPGAVVFVLSAAPVQTLANGKTRATGYFLNEFYAPYRAVKDAGYDVVIATIEGRPPTVDPESLKPQYWEDAPELLEEAQAFVAADPSMERPLPLSEVHARAAEFQGIVVPGGQGVMVDLLDDADLHRALLTFGRAGKAVGLVCHAPAVLTRLPEDDNPFMGSRVTSVSGFEEFYIERVVMKGRALDRAIGRSLSRKGYRHESRGPGRPFAVRDCTLATSQNPFSGGMFDAHLLDALELARSGARCG